MASRNQTRGRWLGKLGRIASALLLCGVPAAGCHPAPPPASRATASALANSDSPRVYFVASKAACPEDHMAAGMGIELGISADLRYAKKHFASSVAVVEGEAPLAQLKLMLAKDARAGQLAHGVVVFYTGHGYLHPGVPAGSRLCSDQPAMALGELVQSVTDLGPPWAVFVVNACESSYVDISRSSIPVAIVSASPRRITVHNTADTCRRESAAESPPSPFAKAFVDVLSSSDSHHDVNRDGTISTRELMRAIRQAAFDAEKQCRASFIEPQLQLNSPCDLPVRHSGPKATPAQELMQALTVLETGTDDDRRVAQAVRAQIERVQLPTLAFDWMATHEAGKVRCNTDALREAGRQLGVSAFRCPPGRLTWEQLKQLATFASFMEVFELRPRGAFLDVIRLRDERLMSTSRAESPLDALPHRLTRVLERADGTDVYRVLGAMPPNKDCGLEPKLCKALEARTFAVCWEEEGQCFTAKRNAE